MRPTSILLSILTGLVGALALDLWPVPALIVVTVLLIVGIATRAATAVLATAIASAVILALWILASTRCDPAIQDCTLEAPELILFGWLALLLVGGLAATLRLVARSRPR